MHRRELRVRAHAALWDSADEPFMSSEFLWMVGSEVLPSFFAVEAIVAPRDAFSEAGGPGVG